MPNPPETLAENLDEDFAFAAVAPPRIEADLCGLYVERRKEIGMLSEEATAGPFLGISFGTGEGEGGASAGVREDGEKKYRKEEQGKSFFCEIHGSAPFLRGRGGARWWFFWSESLRGRNVPPLLRYYHDLFGAHVKREREIPENLS
jgi:hypothetical protein